MGNKFNRNLLKGVTKLLSMSLVMSVLVVSLGGCKGKETTDDASAKASSTSSSTAKNTTSSSKSTSSAKATEKNTQSPTASADASAKPTEGKDAEKTETTKPEQTGTEETGTEGTGTEQTTAPEQSEDSEYTPEQGSGSEIVEEEVFDLGGRKIVIGDWSVNGLEDARYASNADGATNTQKKGYESLKYQEQKYNCDIEFMKFNKGIDDFMQATMAGQVFADAFVTMNSYIFPRAANMGLILPLDDYIDFYNDPLWQHSESATAWKGKHYALKDPYDYPTNGTWINYDVIERAGVTDPYDLWQAGNWNWETFLDICNAVTDDLDGDGVTDQWGVLNSVARYFIYSNGGEIVAYNESTGRYEYSLNDPRNVRAIQFWGELRSVYNVVGSGSYAEFAQGTAAFMFHQLLNGARVYEGGCTNLGYVPFPNGPDVSSDYITNSGTDIMMIAFPANIQDPEKVVKVVSDFRCIWDETKPYYLSIKESVDVRMDENYVTGKFRDWCYNATNTKPDNAGIFGKTLSNLLDKELFNKVQNQELSVTAALEAVRAQANDIVNSLQDVTE